MPIATLQPLLKGVGMAENRFLYGLDRTADDRLSWSPGGEAKTPLAVAGRLAGFLEFFTYMLQHHTMPERPTTLPPPPGSRNEAKAAVEAAFGQLRTILEGMTEADLATPLPTPWGTTIPAREMIGWINGVTSYWQGQLNYI